MYSDRVISARIAEFERVIKRELKQFSVAECAEFVERLKSCRGEKDEDFSGISFKGVGAEDFYQLNQ